MSEHEILKEYLYLQIKRDLDPKNHWDNPSNGTCAEVIDWFIKNMLVPWVSKQ